jgi:hypothetical protein
MSMTPTLASEAPALDTKRCPACGAANHCVMVAGAKGGVDEPPCWCTQVRIDRAQFARIPAAALNKACLCPACAAAPPCASLVG